MSDLEAPRERFPISSGVLAIWSFAILTLPFIGLSVDSTPVLSAKSQILLGMFLTGGFLLFAISVVYSKRKEPLALIKPDKPFQTLTLGQALVIVAGFLIISAWQLFANQAFFASTLAPYQSGSTIITPGPATASIFKIDAAIAEENLFGALTIGLFLFLVYTVHVDKLWAAGITLPMVGSGFAWFHFYVLGTNIAGLVFVFGARVALSGVLLATIYYARKTDSRGRRILEAAALVGPQIDHIGWNLVT